jgi:hypothetical protein
MIASVNAAPESGNGDSPKLRLAGKSEVVGYWKMVQMTDATRQQINKVDPWPLPHQWFVFYDDGRYNSMQQEVIAKQPELAAKDEQMTVKELDMHFATGPSQQYELLESHGIYRIRHPEGLSQFWVIWICDKEFYIKDSRVEAGDLLMALLSQNVESKNVSKVYYRQLRRME